MASHNNPNQSKDESSSNRGSTFANDPQKASEAGKKGGQHSHSGQQHAETSKSGQQSGSSNKTGRDSDESVSDSSSKKSESHKGDKGSHQK